MPAKTDFNWAEIRNGASEKFGGDVPGPALEERLITVFVDHPQTVVDAIDHTVRAYAKGRIHSPWVIATREAEERFAAARRAETVKAGPDRDKCVRLAKRQIDLFGHVYEAEDEVIDEWFGRDHDLNVYAMPRILTPWRTDAELREEILEHWREAKRESLP